MPKLYFDAAELRRVVEHSIASPQAKKLVDYKFDKATGEGEPVMADVAKPAVTLVHDQGVYLMSNGEPGDPLDPSAGEGKYFKRYVAYARGCHPQKDDDWHETARHLVGGDDFGETLEWADEIKALIDRGATRIVINFGKRNVSLSAA